VKVLLCHNYYQEAGGEDRVFADEGCLLEAHGHDVVRFTNDNDHIKQMGRWDVARRTIWNRQTASDLRALMRRERPDVMHCTNTFPLMSPAIYYAAQAEGVAVVQSLHNYRLICPGSLLLRDGRACEACVGKRIAWPGVLHKCYRDNRAASTVVATMLAVHHARETWTRAVSQYVALTEFSRQKFTEGGLPAERIAVKPNFIQVDAGTRPGDGHYAVYVGRLSQEKGIDTLLAAWSSDRPGIPLRIVGDGPLAQKVRLAAERNPRIQWLGQRPPDEVSAVIGDAACLVMPSVCYEHCPKVLLEAFVAGTPAVASRIGALTELVDHGRTGVHVEPGDPEDLASTMQGLSADPAVLRRMRQAARQEYEDKYTAERNYRLLMDIYANATGTVAPARGARRGSRVILRSVAGERRADPAAQAPVVWPSKVNLFGVEVSPTSYESLIPLILEAARRRLSGVISCQAVHAVVSASRDRSLRDRVNTFDVVAPDGQPVRWALNLLHDTQLSERVYGPELMLRLCRRAADTGIPIYLYGSSPEVIGKLRTNLCRAVPRLRVAGVESPPFRALTPAEDEAAVERINASGARLVFVGLGCPKQDVFAYEHRARIKAVQVCVGAAFDFHAGVMPMAPGWMQRRGLEWAFRLVQEPRRLWRRYLVTNSLFAVKLSTALCRRSLRASSRRRPTGSDAHLQRL
jgi:exopolysaccharide biosynthesis WecB/TagA/CpsF family protein